MLKLGVKLEPYSFEILPGILIEVRPITSFDMFLAQEQAQKKINALAEGIEACSVAGIIDECPSFDINDIEQRSAKYMEFLSSSLGERCILGWSGVVDANDEPMPVSPEAISMVMRIWPCSKVFIDQVTDHNRKLFAAKKESGVAQDGISSPAAAPNTAADVKSKDCPAHPASPESTGKNALISRMLRKLKKKFTPGT